jgi:alpha-beta hydrolase superfamily lysophospholipase
MTIAGELLDLQAAVEHAQARTGEHEVALVAASFGAVSATLSLPFLGGSLRGLALWYPVLDLRRTFVEPELPWPRASFTAAALEGLRSEGFLLLDDRFQVGRVLYEEMSTYDPRGHFVAARVPSLIVHGDADEAVDHEISAAAAREHGDCELVTLPGAGHGFEGPGESERAIAATLDWLAAR